MSLLRRALALRSALLALRGSVLAFGWTLLALATGPAILSTLGRPFPFRRSIGTLPFLLAFRALPALRRLLSLGALALLPWLVARPTPLGIGTARALAIFFDDVFVRIVPAWRLLGVQGRDHGHADQGGSNRPAQYHLAVPLHWKHLVFGPALALAAFARLLALTALLRLLLALLPLALLLLALLPLRLTALATLCRGIGTARALAILLDDVLVRIVPARLLLRPPQGWRKYATEEAERYSSARHRHGHSLSPRHRINTARA